MNSVFQDQLREDQSAKVIVSDNDHKISVVEAEIKNQIWWHTLIWAKSGLTTIQQLWWWEESLLSLDTSSYFTFFSSKASWGTFCMDMLILQYSLLRATWKWTGHLQDVWASDKHGEKLVSFLNISTDFPFYKTKHWFKW